MTKSPHIIGHRIAFISYSLDRLDCTCGATMKAAYGDEWGDHRREMGLKTKNIKMGRPPRVPA